MRYVLFVFVSLIAACSSSGGPSVKDFDCTAERYCHAGVFDDEQGVSIVTSTQECARVQVDGHGPVMVCGGKRAMASGGSMATSECRICVPKAGTPH